MATPVEPRILCEIGGVVVAEHGPLVVVVDRGTARWATLVFVLAVLAVVLGGFGAVTLALAATSDATVPWWISATFLLVGIGIGLGVLAIVSRLRRRRSTPLSAYRPVAVFDRARRVFTDGNGVVIAPLDHIRFQRKFQLTSSSPMLVAVTPTETRIIKRANPFNGGLGNLDTVLTAAVFGPPH